MHYFLLGTYKVIKVITTAMYNMSILRLYALETESELFGSNRKTSGQKQAFFKKNNYR